nr:hypothetical protein [Tanacetum cinerariifolium]
SSSKLSRDQTSNPTLSTNPIPKGRIRRSSKQKVENSNFEKNLPPEVPMADNRTMAQLLQAPTEGYEDAIVIPEITATNFELKHGFIELRCGWNFLDKMPSDCLKIIESKSKVRQARAKAVVAKVNSSSLTTAISSDVAELKDMVRALLLDKKNQYSTPSPTPAPIKAIEPNCVTCGGTHAYRNCLVTSGNVYQDNIQDQLHRPQVNQPLAYQAPAYQAPVPQTQSVSQTDFKRYIKANDAVLRNIQSQGQSTQNQCQTMQNQFQTMQNHLANMMDMVSKFMSSNTASSLGPGRLPGNTITNPKEDLKGITTQSDVAYKGPTILAPSKVTKQGTEVTKDQVQTPNSQSTAPVQPTVVQSESKTSVSEPVVAPVSAPMPNLKPSTPYPSRRDNERSRDQDNEQIEKFYKIFKDMSFEISFTDALMLMPKFASTLKALIGNKEKLSEMEDIRLIERLLYDHSSPRPPEEFVSTNSDAEIESFSPSHILVKDSDSLIGEINLSCTPDYPMPPGIEDDDYDSERDILILKDLHRNNTLSFAENESFHFDIPLFSRLSAKPPDGNTGILNIKMMGDISDQKSFMHKITITLALHQEKSPDLLSHQGLNASQPSAKCPMMIHGQKNPILNVLLFHFYPL